MHEISENMHEMSENMHEMSENIQEMSEKKVSNWKGLLALSPMVVFLAVYVVSSVVAGDFYSVPVSAAFIVAAIYSLCITKGKIADKIVIFSRGAGDRNVLLMIWIFMMAGAFASTAKAVGCVDATVNLTLMILPGKLILAGLFLAACFISMAIGTSVGTIVALAPIAAGIASQSGLSLPLVTGTIVGGAFFGDNLSFISDTTIAATTTQGCKMSDKFKNNIWIAGPAAIIVTVIYVFVGLQADVTPEVGTISIVRLLPYLTVIVLALCGIHVMTVLAIGLGLCIAIGLFSGMEWCALLSGIGSGIASMGDLICVTLLAAGLLEIIRINGGLDYIVNTLTRRVHGRKGAEFTVAAIVALSNFCTANNTIAILTSGKIANDITKRFSLNPCKTASILDTFSCVVQGIIPYGPQLLMAAGLTGLAATEIIPWLFYPAVLFVTATLSIVFNFPKGQETGALTHQLPKQ